MSRRPRAGEAAGKVTIRATAAERELWQAAADASGAPSLSDAVRPAITRWAVGVVELKLPRSAKKSRLLSAPREADAGTQRKRCPRCNQRLLVVDGQIEPHMEPPSPRGGAPRQCAGAAQDAR